MTFIDYVEKVIIMEYLKKWENYCIIRLDLSKCIVFSSLLKKCYLVIGVREYKSVLISLQQVKYMFSLFPISQHRCTKKNKNKNKNKKRKQEQKNKRKKAMLNLRWFLSIALCILYCAKKVRNQGIKRACIPRLGINRQMKRYDGLLLVNEHTNL